MSRNFLNGGNHWSTTVVGVISSATRFCGDVSGSANMLVLATRPDHAPVICTNFTTLLLPQSFAALRVIS
jgi:hypothetical protein